MATEWPWRSASAEISIASVVLPVPTSPWNQIPLPSSSRCSSVST